ncbi:hypothetical protein QMA60_09050 [Leuconostoc suionicum]|uniref:hypothetical protein n=1 Tax=Leuconostoc suionicum TaxID=1511761 RepID=UPI0024ACA17D|nr:hypothetical protein [Leuconostoc suionicum]MDI6497888.1 hypothetical protein [Leuconostoc suionicum]MDI6499969.1 hypothetical protein [Leuconostoc suionicum]MDI6502906.1 hypothetical protein [Leuconostoc suionicum]MDI6665765.1 hypothetical protein [Leuconostoc suionicum]
MSKEFKTRKQLLEQTDNVITEAKFVAGSWNVTIKNNRGGDKQTLTGMRVFNLGNSFGIYGMNAGLYELEDKHGHVTLAAVPDRSTLLFLLG